MANKIIGFFRDHNAAEQAKDDLINAGFSHGDVELYSGREGPGLWEKIKEAFGFSDEQDQQLYAEAARRGCEAVLVDLEDEDAGDQDEAVSILQRHNPIDLDTEAGQWRAQGWRGTETAGTQAITRAAQTTAATSQSAPMKGQQRIPVVEEQVNVGKRAVLRGGVRIHTRVTSTPVEKQVQLREEHVRVERRPADRPVNPSDTQAFQERTIEATEMTEQPTVQKTARVVEEVVVGKEANERTETVRDTVRRTDVDVEKISPDSGQVDQAFLDDLTRDERYRGRDWNAVEADARHKY